MFTFVVKTSGHSPLIKIRILVKQTKAVATYIGLHINQSNQHLGPSVAGVQKQIAPISHIKKMSLTIWRSYFFSVISENCFPIVERRRVEYASPCTVCFVNRYCSQTFVNNSICGSLKLSRKRQWKISSMLVRRHEQVVITKQTENSTEA